MLRHLSKFTASTFKYTSSLFSQYNPHEQLSPLLVEIWLKDMQIGLDALLNDQMMMAEDTFSPVTAEDQQQNQLPFHAFGYAILVYTKAMMAMEKSKIDEAVECLLSVDIMLKRIINTTRKKHRKMSQPPSIPSSPPPTTIAAPLTSTNSVHSSHSVPIHICEEQQRERDLLASNKSDEMELQFELLHANCILMSATLQFLKDSWIDHLKAAYDLRKAYKIYERIFETLTGGSISEYQDNAIKQQQQQQRHQRPSSIKTKARRTVSCDNGGIKQQLKQQYKSSTLFDETIKFGAYFGIGLFNVIFSLLPTKVGKILNNLGFHSSRLTAISLLQKAYKSQTMYSPLSALVLLSFYTNITIYIQPHLNEFFLFGDAKCILDRMKLIYPQGKIWCLLEGKMKKLQGQLDASITLFSTLKNLPAIASSHHQQQQQLKESKTDTVPEPVSEDYYFRNTSITEFVQFRSFAIYELGWSYIYAGNYFQASESFFCLASMCNWSRIFYHYISTCCMMADGLFDKAVLEIRQMVKMLDQKKKMCSRISSNEQYAESRIKHWIEVSATNHTSLKDTLRYQIINPLWELVYLWNGTTYWKNEVVVDMKKKITQRWKEQQNEPIFYLFMGVIQRDIEKNIEIALEYFNLVLVTTSKEKSSNSSNKKIDDGWIIPYAMYEIAVTHFNLLLKKRASNGGTNHTCEYKIVISDWVQCIDNYYLQNTQDLEWETRMQIRCQLLIESCNSIP